MNRYVIMKLRVSNKDDFADQFENKRIGTMYFEQSVTGAIQKQPKYFTNETDLATFRELYVNNQIYVAVNFDEVEIVEEKEEPVTQQLQL